MQSSWFTIVYLVNGGAKVLLSLVYSLCLSSSTPTGLCLRRPTRALVSEGVSFQELTPLFILSVLWMEPAVERGGKEPDLGEDQILWSGSGRDGPLCPPERQTRPKEQPFFPNNCYWSEYTTTPLGV